MSNPGCSQDSQQTGNAYPASWRRDPRFPSTHWSVVLAARGEQSEIALQALSELCANYWYPLYAYARRRGKKPEEAEDLTQGFFARLLAKKYLDVADPEKGRLRTFLLTAFKRFLANEWDKERAQKRGGGQRPLSIDAAMVEKRYALEPADAMSPAVAEAGRSEVAPTSRTARGSSSWRSPFRR